MIPDLHRVLEPAYLAGLVETATDDIRSMRAECADLENGVSFVRRLAQGRLDIFAAETKRRADGSGGNLGDLVAMLPELLSDGVRAPASGRVSEDLDPPESVVVPLTERLDAVAAPSVLSSLTDLSDDELAAAVLALRRFEDDLSTSRRTLHASIDTLNDELARRIAAGDANTTGS
jgi:hypothetical protein